MSDVKIQVDLSTDSQIAGWALASSSSDPVSLILKVDGNPLREIICSEFRRDLTTLRSDGCFAFTVRLSDDFVEKLSPTSEVTLEDPETQTVVTVPLAGRGPLSFNPFSGSSERLSLNKDGYLVVQFQDRNDAYIEGLLQFASTLIADMTELGHATYPVYGTLLGAVREGELIPHDDDIDLAYFISSPLGRADVDMFTVDLLRQLERNGYEILSRYSIGQFKVAKGDYALDMFASWVEEGRYYLNFAINGELSAEDVFPLSAISVNGYRFPAPSKPELFCETLYGENWRVPQGGFKWKRHLYDSDLDRPISRRLRYWNEFYGSNKIGLTVPSQFAAFVMNELNSSGGKPDFLVELGCGNGRDLLLLRQTATFTMGCDASDRALAEARARVAGVEFRKVNVYDTVQLEGLVDILNESGVLGDDKRGVIYTRFFLHAVDELGENNILELCRRIADRCHLSVYHEYRTVADEGRQKATKPHYRRYVSHQQLIERSIRAGFSVVYEASGRGMAKYMLDDAIVGRVVLSAGPAQQSGDNG